MARLQSARGTIGALAAQIHGTKTHVAALEAHRLGGEAESAELLRTRDTLADDEARYAARVQGFEEELRRVDEVQQRLRSESRQINEQRRAALDELSPRVKALYVSLGRDGVVPAIASEVEGMCSACRAALPFAVVGEARRGEITSCPQCRRLLCQLREAE